MKLIEHYLSIQGEGLRTGKPSYFVRFARCNLRCSWCDTTYSFGEGDDVSFEKVVAAIKESKVQWVCLTGGEPLLHSEDCLKLCTHLSEYQFDIETGGSLDIRPVQVQNSSIIMDWKLQHSGMNHKMKEENLSYLRSDRDLLKFVTDGSQEERDEIARMIEKTSAMGFPISIQPLFGTEVRPIAEWLLNLKNSRLQLNLQIHKLIWPTLPLGV